MNTRRREQAKSSMISIYLGVVEETEKVVLVEIQTGSDTWHNSPGCLSACGTLRTNHKTI